MRRPSAYAADDSAANKVVVSAESRDPILMSEGFGADPNAPVTAVNRKCRPPGRKCGQRLLVSAYAVSSVVTCVGTPPALDTRHRCEMTSPKRITLSVFHVPPRAS